MNEKNRTIRVNGNYHEDNRTITSNQGNIIENLEGNLIQYASEEEQDLAKAAAEIQKLLEQLEKTYSPDTMTGKMTVAAKAVEQIEKDPSLMQRVSSALKSGGVAGLMQFLNHPAASFLLAAFDDWQKSKKD